MSRPERVLQFGTGVFLRAFVEPLIEQSDFDGSVVVVESMGDSVAKLLNENKGRYDVLLRGVQNGELVQQRIPITCVSRALSARREWSELLTVARSPELRFIVSNTTESGIAFSPEDKLDDQPPASFPGKLTRLMYERFQAGRPGVVMLPCELIERNGEELRKTVLRVAENWNLPSEFQTWAQAENVWTNTLVDRIVTGGPDPHVVEAEPFHLWAIEASPELKKEFPVDAVWANDITPYRERKVRILNGAHTTLVYPALLAGKKTVLECMEDATIRSWMQAAIHEEILPTMDLDPEDLRSFAASVIDRFSNPFVQHQLTKIAVNGVSKYGIRLLPSVRRYTEINGRPPERLLYSLAAMVVQQNLPEIPFNLPIETQIESIRSKGIQFSQS